MNISRIAFSILTPGLVILAVGGLSAPKSLEASSIQETRNDFSVASDPDVYVFVREVRRANQPEATKVPILLLHGARVPGIASFDLEVSGGALATDLTAAGHPVYIMDARGYGGSTRPLEMAMPQDANPRLSVR
jgi:pimeloyl-ACP methyl ester carboxylesterase